MADQLLNIRFTGDVSQLTKAINQAESELTSFESKLKESLGADAFSQISSQIDSLRSKFSTLSAINIKADPSQALSAVESVLADISKLKSSEVLLRADNTQALAAIEQIEGLANDIKVKISVDSSSIDTTKLQNLFAPISEKISLNVSHINFSYSTISSEYELLGHFLGIRFPIYVCIRRNGT